MAIKRRQAENEGPGRTALPGRAEIDLIHPTRGLEPYPGVFMPDIDQEAAGVRHWRPRARLFLALFLALVIGQAVGAVAVNVVVNPRSDFETDLFVPVILNDVRLKTELLDARGSPSLLILGSSRSITVPPVTENGTTEGGFNFAISHGNLPEQHLVYLHARDVAGPPATVVVGIELERLWGDQEVRPHVANSPAGAYADPPPGLMDDLVFLVGTYDHNYLRDSAASILYTLIGHPPSIYGFDESGVRHLRPFEDPELRPSYDVDAAIDVSIQQVIARTERLRDAPRLGTPELTPLVEAVRADGATLHLVFTPFHPRVWAVLEGRDYPRLLAQARSDVRAYCGPGVHVYDFSQVDAFGGDGADFYDGWHFTGTSAEAYMRAIHDGRGDQCPRPDPD